MSKQTHLVITEEGPKLSTGNFVGMPPKPELEAPSDFQVMTHFTLIRRWWAFVTAPSLFSDELMSKIKKLCEEFDHPVEVVGVCELPNRQMSGERRWGLLAYPQHLNVNEDTGFVDEDERRADETLAAWAYDPTHDGCMERRLLQNDACVIILKGDGLKEPIIAGTHTAALAQLEGHKHG